MQGWRDSENQCIEETTPHEYNTPLVEAIDSKPVNPINYRSTIEVNAKIYILKLESTISSCNSVSAFNDEVEESLYGFLGSEDSCPQI
jgi:hypothetical protein